MEKPTTPLVYLYGDFCLLACFVMAFFTLHGIKETSGPSLEELRGYCQGGNLNAKARSRRLRMERMLRLSIGRKGRMKGHSGGKWVAPVNHS